MTFQKEIDMKPFFIEISDDALWDIQDIWSYIFNESPKNSIDFVVGLYLSIGKLEYFPSIGKKIDYWVHIKVYKSHYILYDIEQSSRRIIVLRVIHTSNYPEYQKYFL